AADVPAQQGKHEDPGLVRTDDEEHAHRGGHHLKEPRGAREDPLGQRRIVAPGEQLPPGPPRGDTGNGGHDEGNEGPHAYRSIVAWSLGNTERSQAPKNGWGSRALARRRRSRWSDEILRRLSGIRPTRAAARASKLGAGGASMREFHCKDVGMPDCSFVAKGKDDDEVMR